MFLDFFGQRKKSEYPILCFLEAEVHGLRKSCSNNSEILPGKPLLRSYFNSISASPTEWPNTLKQFVGNLLTNCFSVFGYFVGLALKGLSDITEVKCLSAVFQRY